MQEDKYCIWMMATAIVTNGHDYHKALLSSTGLLIAARLPAAV
jgi:hypothetical protein